ncbi:hypothetical protein [Bacteriovorax sp. Seq25_V]|uniref:hypothetical protein n=1 Tax=Bacteriovorax sp. Seq25_V TaxID=1201288 RepID=UPI000389F999|nr:hypothetical protein [Bacteriovorax sp. Seq25_V]EQC44308.1 hypothetical protein M900_A0274 [Bacteriovorax sp. Seq25_V]
MKYKLLILSLLTISTFAKSEQIRSKMSKLTFEVPNKWNYITDLYGIPHSVIGDSEDEKKRTIISIIPTNRKFSELENIDFKADQANYEKGRLKWLKQYKGKALKFSSYKKNTLKGFQESHQYGYQYSLGDTAKEEITIFAKCNQELIHLKVMSQLNDNESIERAMNVLNSMVCEKR